MAIDKKWIIGGGALIFGAILILTHDKKSTSSSSTSGTAVTNGTTSVYVPSGNYSNAAGPVAGVSTGAFAGMGSDLIDSFTGDSGYSNDDTQPVNGGGGFTPDTVQTGAAGTVQIGPGLAEITNGQGNVVGTYEPIAPDTTQWTVLGQGY